MSLEVSQKDTACPHCGATFSVPFMIRKIEQIKTPLSSENATSLWLKLAEYASMTTEMQTLFDALTKRLTFDANIGEITMDDIST